MPLSERQQQIKERFVAERGFWDEAVWASVLDLDPDLLDAYIDWSSVPWRKGHLEPKVKEFLYLAMDVSTTHLYHAGIRVHMVNAIAQGATRDEVLELLQIVAEIGLARSPSPSRSSSRSWRCGANPPRAPPTRSPTTCASASSACADTGMGRCRHWPRTIRSSSRASCTTPESRGARDRSVPR